MNKNYWYILLQYWVNEYNGVGLTIPFIIGAPSVKGKDTFSVRKLFSFIKEYDSPKPLALNYCSDIGDFVIQFYNDKLKLHPRQTQVGNLRFTQSSQLLGNDLETIISSLEKKYNSNLNDAKFSIKSRNYGLYSIEEEEFIKKYAFFIINPFDNKKPRTRRRFKGGNLNKTNFSINERLEWKVCSACGESPCMCSHRTNGTDYC